MRPTPDAAGACSGSVSSVSPTLTHELAGALDALQEQMSAAFANHTPRRALAACATGGFSVLGVGGRRLAVAAGAGLVAKLAFRREGLVDNELEWRVWRGASETLRELLAPTVGRTPGGVNLQRRCLPVSPDALELPHQLTRPLARAGITDAVLNLGLLDERVVCYDYALLAPERARMLLSGPPR